MIQNVANQTGHSLVLWDNNDPFITIPAGGAVHGIPPVITSVSVGNQRFYNREGMFRHLSNYGVTFVPAVHAPPGRVDVRHRGVMAHVNFAGNGGPSDVVSFR